VNLVKGIGSRGVEVPAVHVIYTEEGGRAQSSVGNIGAGGIGVGVDGIGTVEHLDGDVALISIADGARWSSQTINYVETVDETVPIVVESIVANLGSTETDTTAIGIGAIGGAVSIVVDTIAASHTVTLETIRETTAVGIQAIDETIEIIVDTVVADLRADCYKVYRELSYSGSTRCPGTHTDLVGYSCIDTYELDVTVIGLASGEDPGISITGDLYQRGAIVGGIFIDQQVSVPTGCITGVNLCTHVLVGSETEPDIVVKRTPDCAGNTWQWISTESGGR
jgi:hypothetical protein